MIVEALIEKATGDIIVVKPTGAPWSAKERDGPIFCVVELNDPDLKLKGGVKSYPYKVMGYRAGVVEEEIMVAVSRWKINKKTLARGAKFHKKDLKQKQKDYDP